jgi:hypothetical protein
MCELSFAPYAKASCSQQNPEISSKTLQDHGAWESPASAFFSAALAVCKKRKAQAPFEQSGASGRNGRRQDQGKPPIWLNCAFCRASPVQGESLTNIGGRLLVERSLRFELSLWRRTTGAPLPANPVTVPDYKDRAG